MQTLLIKMKKKAFRFSYTLEASSFTHLHPPHRHLPKKTVIKRGFAVDVGGMGLDEALNFFLLRDDDYMLRVNKLFRKICLARACTCSREVFFSATRKTRFFELEKEEKGSKNKSSIKSLCSDELKLDSKWKIVIRKSL